MKRDSATYSGGSYARNLQSKSPARSAGKIESPAIASPASIQNTPFPSSTKATAKGARLEEAQQLASPGPAQIGTYAGATAAASGGMGGGGAAIPMTTAKDQFASPALRASPMAGDSEPISTPTASGAIEPRRIGFSPSQGLTASVQFEGMGESEDVVRTPPPATDSTGKFLMIPTPPSVEKSAGGASLSAGRRGMESAGSDARDRVETPQLKYMMKSALKESSEVLNNPAPRDSIDIVESIRSIDRATGIPSRNPSRGDLQGTPAASDSVVEHGDVVPANALPTPTSLGQPFSAVRGGANANANAGGVGQLRMPEAPPSAGPASGRYGDASSGLFPSPSPGLSPLPPNELSLSQSDIEDLRSRPTPPAVTLAMQAAAQRAAQPPDARPEFERFVQSQVGSYVASPEGLRARNALQQTRPDALQGARFSPSPNAARRLPLPSANRSPSPGAADMGFRPPAADVVRQWPAVAPPAQGRAYGGAGRASAQASPKSERSARSGASAPQGPARSSDFSFLLKGRPARPTNASPNVARSAPVVPPIPLHTMRASGQGGGFNPRNSANSTGRSTAAPSRPLSAGRALPTSGRPSGPRSLSAGRTANPASSGSFSTGRPLSGRTSGANSAHSQGNRASYESYDAFEDPAALDRLREETRKLRRQLKDAQDALMDEQARGKRRAKEGEEDKRAALDKGEQAVKEAAELRQRLKHEQARMKSQREAMSVMEDRLKKRDDVLREFKEGFVKIQETIRTLENQVAALSRENERLREGNGSVEERVQAERERADIARAELSRLIQEKARSDQLLEEIRALHVREAAEGARRHDTELQELRRRHARDLDEALRTRVDAVEAAKRELEEIFTESGEREVRAAREAIREEHRREVEALRAALAAQQGHAAEQIKAALQAEHTRDLDVLRDQMRADFANEREILRREAREQATREQEIYWKSQLEIQKRDLEARHAQEIKVKIDSLAARHEAELQGLETMLRAEQRQASKKREENFRSEEDSRARALEAEVAALRESMRAAAAERQTERSQAQASLEILQTELAHVRLERGALADQLKNLGGPGGVPTLPLLALAPGFDSTSTASLSHRGESQPGAGTPRQTVWRTPSVRASKLSTEGVTDPLATEGRTSARLASSPRPPPPPSTLPGPAGPNPTPRAAAAPTLHVPLPSGAVVAVGEELEDSEEEEEGAGEVMEGSSAASEEEEEEGGRERSASLGGEGRPKNAVLLGNADPFEPAVPVNAFSMGSVEGPGEQGADPLLSSFEATYTPQPPPAAPAPPLRDTVSPLTALQLLVSPSAELTHRTAQPAYTPPLATQGGGQGGLGLEPRARRVGPAGVAPPTLPARLPLPSPEPQPQPPAAAFPPAPSIASPGPELTSASLSSAAPSPTSSLGPSPAQVKASPPPPPPPPAPAAAPSLPTAAASTPAPRPSPFRPSPAPTSASSGSSSAFRFSQKVGSGQGVYKPQLASPMTAGSPYSPDDDVDTSTPKASPPHPAAPSPSMGSTGGGLDFPPGHGSLLEGSGLDDTFRSVAGAEGNAPVERTFQASPVDLQKRPSAAAAAAAAAVGLEPSPPPPRMPSPSPAKLSVFKADLNSGAPATAPPAGLTFSPSVETGGQNSAAKPFGLESVGSVPRPLWTNSQSTGGGTGSRPFPPSPPLCADPPPPLDPKVPIDPSDPDFLEQVARSLEFGFGDIQIVTPPPNHDQKLLLASYAVVPTGATVTPAPGTPYGNNSPATPSPAGGILSRRSGGAQAPPSPRTPPSTIRPAAGTVGVGGGMGPPSGPPGAPGGLISWTTPRTEKIQSLTKEVEDLRGQLVGLKSSFQAGTKAAASRRSDNRDLNL